MLAQMLLDLRGEDNHVWLFCNYGRTWSCHFETRGDMKMKIEVEGATPEEAVEKCHNAYRRVQKALPEMAVGELPAPLGDDFLD